MNLFDILLASKLRGGGGASSAMGIVVAYADDAYGGLYTITGSMVIE